MVVSEGYELTYASGERQQIAQPAPTDQFGHVRLGGIGDVLAREIEERTGYETRVTVLGHIQRGGTPTARDRILATRYGLKAADLVHEGRWGTMAALRGDDIVEVPLRDAVAELKRVRRRVLRSGEDLLRLRPSFRHALAPHGCASPR